MLRHLTPEQRQKLLLTLIWGGMVGQELDQSIGRLLRVALVGIIIDADAVGASADKTLDVLQRAVLAAMDPDGWYDSQKTMAENNVAMRDVVRAAAAPVEEIAVAVDEFLEVLGEERVRALAEHFEEEVLPTFMVLADHVFDGAVSH